MLYSHIRNNGCRINTNYFYKDLRVAVLENEYLRISILIDKGTDIFEFLYKPKDIDFMWLSPWGIKSPSKFVSSVASREGNFMDFYEGGWQEILPNFGTSNNYKEAELGLHGEISLYPWDYKILEDKPSVVSIKFTIRTTRTPFLLEKILTLKKDDPKLYISEKLKNEGYADVDLMWCHHPAIGGIFLDDSVVIDVPRNEIVYVRKHKNVKGESRKLKKKIKEKWPILAGICGEPINYSKSPLLVDVEQDMDDELCLGNLENGWYAITNLNKKVGFSMKWDKKTFPFIWIWRTYGKGTKSPPWWGRVNCMALEPCSSFSPTGLNGAIENNSSIKMKPQQEIKTTLMAIAYEKDGNVKKIDENGYVS